MINMEYCHAKKEGGLYALSQGTGLNVSYKDLVQVCSNIRGRNAQAALAFLESAGEGLSAVRYFSNNKHLGHRRELGGRKGRYPKKAAKMAYDILKNAIANANALGFTNPKVHHVCANKERIFGRSASKGRSARSDFETANIQIVLRDSREGKAKTEQTAETAKSKVQKTESKTQSTQAKQTTQNAQIAVSAPAALQKEPAAQIAIVQEKAIVKTKTEGEKTASTNTPAKSQSASGAQQAKATDARISVGSKRSLPKKSRNGEKKVE
ncbi:hypothetical protein AUJ17_01985 [Candidatus Micrarchaeota archaeon CG1_02_47_40]|nr:MAG: hypothetical protein AUJ17_01985 [Candidatus Micrarchaeota archaeon CG1_02_47_40]